MRKIISLFALLFVCSTNCILAQSGILDCDFSADGKTAIDISAHADYASDVAIQADGKIIAAGTTYNGTSEDFVIIRYTTDGNFDNTFGVNGIDTIDFGGLMDVASSIVIQQDGKIIVAGYSYDFMNVRSVAIVRLNNDGSLDNTFGNNGKINNNYSLSNIFISSAIIQPDGKFIVGGNFDTDFLVIRYKSDGTPDSTFGINGFVSTDFNNAYDLIYKIALQPDGKIIASGISDNNVIDNDFAIVRYNSNGTLDTTFSIDGKLTTAVGTSHDYARDMKLQPDGKIIVGGRVVYEGISQIGVVRYNTDGTLDLSFNSGGKLFVNAGNAPDLWAIALQPDGKIILGGYSSSIATWDDFTIVRVNTNGSIDSTFGTDGISYADFNQNVDRIFAMALQDNGRIVAVGYAVISTTAEDFAVARFISDLDFGVIDFAKDANSVFIYPNPVQKETTIEYELLDNEILSVDLSDINGKLIKTFISNESRNKGKHKETLNFDESINTGNYILSIKNNSQSQSIKIIKK